LTGNDYATSRIRILIRRTIATKVTQLNHVLLPPTYLNTEFHQIRVYNFELSSEITCIYEYNFYLLRVVSRLFLTFWLLLFYLLNFCWLFVFNSGVFVDTVS